MIRLSGETNDITIDGVSVATEPEVDTKVLAGKISTGQRKNYLINGNFDMWQYGTSQTTSGYGSDDRWSNLNVGSTKTHSMVNATDTERALFSASKFSRTVVTSVAGADSQAGKRQSVENVTLLAGKTVTLSFWAKADGNKNIAIRLFQVFGTGGSPSVDISSNQQLIQLTTTWQKKTIVLNIPSIIGKTLGTDGVHTSSTGLKFYFDAGSNIVLNEGVTGMGQQSGTFDIAQIKLEDGSVATDGWHPYDGEFGGEVQACQRYYEKSFNLTTTPSNGATTTSFSTEEGLFSYSSMNGLLEGGFCAFKSEKRVVPTVVKYGNSNGHWCMVEAANTSLRQFDATLSNQKIGTFGFSAGQQVRNALFIMCAGHWSASAEL